MQIIALLKFVLHGYTHTSMQSERNCLIQTMFHVYTFIYMIYSLFTLQTLKKRPFLQYRLS